MIGRLINEVSLNTQTCRNTISAEVFGILAVHHLEDGEEETWASGADRRRTATPCWWFIRHAKICALGSTFETPHALWLTRVFLLCFLLSSTIIHAAGLKNIPRAVKKQHNTVLFPPLHVLKGWKSTDSAAPKTFVSWCYTFVHALLTGNVWWRKGSLEMNSMGQVEARDIPRTP